MELDCATVRYLQRISGPDTPLAMRKGGSVPGSALEIIADMQDHRMTPKDLECLHWLVEAICQEGHGELASHIQAEACACEICAALAAKMKDLPPQR